jgi:hypothetical protein
MGRGGSFPGSLPISVTASNRPPVTEARAGAADQPVNTGAAGIINSGMHGATSSGAVPELVDRPVTIKELVGQCRSDLGQRLALAPQGTGSLDQGRVRLPVALAALALAGLAALALACGSELGDEGGLFELADSAQHLAHQDGGRGIGEERFWTIDGNELDALGLQEAPAGWPSRPGCSARRCRRCG